MTPTSRSADGFGIGAVLGSATGSHGFVHGFVRGFVHEEHPTQIDAFPAQGWGIRDERRGNPDYPTSTRFRMPPHAHQRRHQEAQLTDAILIYDDFG